MRIVELLVGVALVVALVSCDCTPRTSDQCVNTSDCLVGECINRVCVTNADGGRDGAPEVSTACTPCGNVCCAGGQRCFQTNQCIVDLGRCIDTGMCPGDSYCDRASGFCTPYGVPASVTNDNDCGRTTSGEFSPRLQCAWPGTNAVSPVFNQVYSAPMVADFNLDNDPLRIAPSIVFTSFARIAGQDPRTTMGGMLRVIDGRTCEEQATLVEEANRLIYSSNNAIGDLDLAADNRPEIVATAFRVNAGSAGSPGGLVAFRYNAQSSRFERLWYGRDCSRPGEPRHYPAGQAVTENNGPSLHDLDNDGYPEVIFDIFVYDRNGCVLNPDRVYSPYLGLGLFPVVADVDNDGEPELVHSTGVYRWDAQRRDWAPESYWNPPTEDRNEAIRPGHIAVADFGDFPGAVGNMTGAAEIVVVSAPSATSTNEETGSVRVMTLAGDIIFGPIAIPSGGRGGAPTIADFDGDGHREIGVAGSDAYSVFDFDCVGLVDSGCARRAGQALDGVLWSRPSQDTSSNVTGSSVFDFNGDGAAEVVYRDECFLRVYSGADGEVLYSEGASSGTGYDYPVIADVDGDFNTEIVVPMTNLTGCPATDPIYTRGVSASQNRTGIAVLRDASDRWVPSRTLWNQYDYSITNVLDNGRVPQTNAWMRNHSNASLNNYRMNTQGAGSPTGLADLTVRLSNAQALCDSETSLSINLQATVCNRGTNPVSDGASVVFYNGNPDNGAQIACQTTLPMLLQPSTCAEVGCLWTVPDGADPSQLLVVVDPENQVTECRDGNNRGVVPAAYCGLQ